MNNRTTLNWEEFQAHMRGEQLSAEPIVYTNIRGGHLVRVQRTIQRVVIRSGEGIDYGLAAVHTEAGPDGDTLVFDMGHALEEVP